VRGARTKTKMTVDQYLKKYEGTVGKFELVDGVVISMAAERVRHTLAKGEAYTALKNAVKKAGLSCQVFADSVSLRTGSHSLREPDVAVQCGKRADPDAMTIEEPIILVEVISPSSEFRDVHSKLFEYFAIPSVQHYIVVDQGKRLVLHNKRDGKNKVQTQFLHAGIVHLKPPGLKVKVADLLGAS
jgi:Uma2 family endonuclease